MISPHAKKIRLFMLLFVPAVLALVVFLVSVPLPTHAASTCSFTPASGFLGGKSLPCDGALLANYIVELNKFFYRLAIVLAVLMITIGGFQWLVAMGNSSKIGAAKETIEQAVIGLALAFTAFLIFSQIDESFVRLGSLTIGVDKDKLKGSCGQFFDEQSCKTQSLHVGLTCQWDATECPNGVPNTQGKPCCKGGAGSGVTLNGTCTNATVSDCTQQYGCYVATVNGQTQCNSSPNICIETKAEYSNFQANYPTIRPQCCVSPAQGGVQTYAWANYVFNMATNCALICGGSGASGWTEVDNNLCLSNVP